MALEREVALGVLQHPHFLSGILLDHTTITKDPGRVLDCVRAERHIGFQYLVRRYICQILYGCRNLHCTTPTCLSCKKRMITTPLRIPTQITARTLAHFLASQDDPYGGLCPNALVILPFQLEITGENEVGLSEEKHAQTSKDKAGRNMTDWRCDEGPNECESAASHSPASQGSVSQDGPSLQSRSDNHVEDFWQSINDRHQTKKDYKSLGQNLFDTVAVIYSYSRNIPNPLQVFQPLRQSLPGKRIASEEHESRDHQVRAVYERHSGNASVMLAGNPLFEERTKVNGHSDLIHVQSSSPTKNETQCFSPNNSSLHQQKSTKGPITQIYSEILPNGQKVQLRRIKQRLPYQQLANGHITTTAEGLGKLDGTDERPMSIVSAKQSSLNLSSSPIQNSRASPAQTADQRANPQGRKDVTDETGLPVISHLSCAIMDDLAKHTYRHRVEQSPTFAFTVDYDKHFRLCPTKPFVNRSLYYTLSDPATLLASFREEEWKEGKGSPLPHLNAVRLTDSFRFWNQRNGSLIFDSLWKAAESLFIPPPELDVQKSPMLKAARKSTDSFQSRANSANLPDLEERPVHYLSDIDAAHIIMICMHALTALVPTGWPSTWSQIRRWRSWGIILPQSPKVASDIDAYRHPWLSIVDELEYEPALRLAERLVRGIAARRCFSEISQTLSNQANDKGESVTPKFDLMHLLISHLTVVEQQRLLTRKRFNGILNTDKDPGWTVPSVFMEWLRTILIKKWDGKAEVNRWTSVGAAVDILGDFYEHRKGLNLDRHMFEMPYLHERMDQIHAPNEFLNRSNSFRGNPNTLHLLSYSFLFCPRHIVAYFRTVNYSNMYKQYELAQRTAHMRRQLGPYMDERHWWMITQRMKETLAEYLVLDVSRDHPLQDAFDQLWGLQKRQLLKPLKVKMGAQEGEVGVDQGGVSLEFFRVILSEVFNPDNGMFTIDPQTRMTWIQPTSLEPLHRFELIGILFSLAIFNGVTLPVTFPLAFYRRLLDKPVTNIEDIRDGWPELAKAFTQLISWSDGDVGDVFVRTYSFSFDALGQRMDVDMEAFGREHPWPQENTDSNQPWDSSQLLLTHREDSYSSMTVGKLNDPVLDWLSSNRGIPPSQTMSQSESTAATESQEAILVTNDNRVQYVSDYIFWLTDKSIRPQFEAFRKGFHTCLHRASLQLFTPETLQTLVEGHQDIDIRELKKAVRYEDGYSSTHPTIAYFWSTVQKFTLEEKKHLLEFVTASDRVPVNGVASIQFSIVKNTSDTELLPTSSTCFGKLMLPDYASREKLERKLRLALQNSKGFGAV